MLCVDARGQFSYWSQRTFARPVNKGLRLDYFVCSRDMFPPKLEPSQDHEDSAAQDPAGRSAVDVSKMPSPGVYDSYILHEDTVGCSDHCPVVLVLQL